MSTIDEHCKQSLERFGNEFREVHKWLDFYKGTNDFDGDGKDYSGPYSGVRHREKRHHWDGIEECVEEFGEVVREVAKMHIFDDFKDHPNPEYRGRIPSSSHYPAIFWKRE